MNKMQCQMDQERVKAQQQVIRMEEEAKLMKERMDTHINLENKLKEQVSFLSTLPSQFYLRSFVEFRLVSKNNLTISSIASRCCCI